MSVTMTERTAAALVARERPATALGGIRWPRTPLASSALRMAILAVWALYFLVPIYWLVVASTKRPDALYSTPALAFDRPQLWTNLSDLWTYDGGIYFRWLLNSALYAIAGAAIGTAVAGMAGYYLAMYRFRGRETLFNVVITGMLVPGTALALPLFLLFARVNLSNTYWAVLLPSIVSPFSLFVCRLSAEASVPNELVEAGRIDGAGDLRIFVAIAARLMVPGLITSFLAQFVGIWNNFLLPLVMLSNQNLYPVTLGLDTWQGQTNHIRILQTLTLTGALVSIVPLLIAFMFLQRFWRNGLASGGIKA